MRQRLTKTNARWIAIFLLFATSPQIFFKLIAKVLRPVVKAADEIAESLES